MTVRAFKRALITGVNGSGGSYLAEHIASEHPLVEIHGLSRWHSTTLGNLDAILDLVTVHEADLMDFGSTVNALQASRPDVVFHLAAHANVQASFLTPHTVVQNNVLGTVNLFEAIRHVGLSPVIQLCSTSEVYGQVDPKNVPIKEDAPMRPVSPYAVSKAAQDLLGWSYFVSYGLPIIRTRMFAYLNPRRADLFASSFARQIARIEKGLQSELLHGNLESVRTMIDVRDAVAAYWVAAERCEPGEAYNIGGTTTITVGEVLDALVARSIVPIKRKADPTLFRPADVTLQIPSVEKFRQATGWTPTRTFDESLEALLQHWRQAVAHESAETRIGLGRES
jgi:GDP-mannose 4,6-dehydratase